MMLTENIDAHGAALIASLLSSDEASAHPVQHPPTFFGIS